MIRAVSLNLSLDKSLTVEKIVFGDVNRVERSRVDPGSKGVNIARFLTYWGESAIVYGLAGGAVGRQIASLLKKEEVPFVFVPVKDANRVIINVFESNGCRELRINEPGPVIAPQEINRFLIKLFAGFRENEVLVISGSLPERVPVAIYRRIIHQAKKKNIKVFLDTEGRALESGLEARPFLIKPNRFELSRLIGRRVRSLDAVVNAARAIQSKMAEAVVVSAGDREAVLVCSEGIWIARPPAIKVSSSVGAGDAMLAGIVFSLFHNNNWEKSFRFGVAAGSAKASTEGTKLCSLNQIKRLLPQVKLKKMSSSH